MPKARTTLTGLRNRPKQANFSCLRLFSCLSWLILLHFEQTTWTAPLGRGKVVGEKGGQVASERVRVPALIRASGLISRPGGRPSTPFKRHGGPVP